MKTNSSFSEYSYHTWRDLGGPLGLFIDMIFCAFVMVSALLMLALGSLLLALDYLAAPVIAWMTRPRPARS